VRAVANELQVRLKVAHADDQIALDAARALALHGSLPDSIQAAVRAGHITLTGRVPWLFHKTSAETVVRHIPGVVGVTNRIEVTPMASFRDVRKRITEALHRAADLNARHVRVDIKGSTVTLTGTVSTWGQRDIAERAAAEAPGIARVENLIDVVPSDI
jgi:osmotically-inducible protein OsmY